MLNGAVVTRDPQRRCDLQHLLAQVQGFFLAASWNEYPGETELGDYVDCYPRSILIVDLCNEAGGLEFVSRIRCMNAQVEVIAICKECHSESLLRMMRAGVREAITLPLRRQDLVKALVRLREAPGGSAPTAGKQALTCTFLPAKPGAGASFACLNTAAALARHPQSQPVSVLDFDFQCGGIEFMLNLPGGFSIREAAENPSRTLWESRISRMGQLHVVTAGKPDPSQPLRLAQALAVLNRATRFYSRVCVDLPGALDAIALETLRLSDHIFLVSTAEPATLRMAHRTLDLLRAASLGDHTRLILNRTLPNSLVNRYQIEEELQCPVATAIPNDYEGVQRALTLGRAIVLDGGLAARFADFADSLTATPLENSGEGWNLSSRFRQPKKSFLSRLFTGV